MYHIGTWTLRDCKQHKGVVVPSVAVCFGDFSDERRACHIHTTAQRVDANRT